jgi:hypothetical protein
MYRMWWEDAVPKTPGSDQPKTAEEVRLDEAREKGMPWKQWGPHLSERQWGTVREDSSEVGDAWNYFTHDQAIVPTRWEVCTQSVQPRVVPHDQQRPISMSDKWEYRWFAAWDLAFHAMALSTIDIDFAKQQLDLLLKSIHPTGPGHFGVAERGIVALVNQYRLRRILTRMLDESEFLSP